MLTVTSMRDALTAGLAWLYDTVQPAGAVLQHHGITLWSDETTNRALSLAPAAWRDEPVFVVEVRTAEWDDSGPFRVLANPIRPGELEEISGLLAELGAAVSDTWNGYPTRSGSLALTRRAHPTLREAVRQYKAGCPHHGSVFCRCGWYPAGYARLIQPVAGEHVG